MKREWVLGWEARLLLLATAVLVVFGLILFGHTMYNLSLAWLDQWWPMAIVILGAYLIYQAVMARRAAQDAAANK